MVMKKIFIVEDNHHLLGYLENDLRKSGFEVLTARSGLAAIELLAEQRVDAIFIDYFLPNLNADRLCQIIRRMEHLKNAYIVVMSAAAHELNMDLSSIGANALIAKGSFKETAALMISALEAAENPPADGTGDRIMGIDLVHPRQMTKELLAQNRHLQAMLDSISEGIVEIYQGHVVYANPASEKLFGISQGKILASYLPDLLDERLRPQIEMLVKGGEKDLQPNHEIRKILLDDRTLWIKRLPLLGDSETIILLLTDVTERIRAEESLREYQQHLEALVEKRTSDLKRANEKLRQVQKMEAVGIIAGGVAHDLNNILSGIVSYPDLLLLELPENSSLRKPVLTIKKSGEKAAAIVQDLLTLARRGVSADDVVNLNAIIKDYLKSPEYMKMKSYHAHVRVEKHLDKECLNIMGSSLHLSKTTMNLVSNAAEAIPEGGKILISTKNQYVDRDIRGYEDITKGEYVILTVADTGVGISKADQGRVFEPFYTKKTMGRSGTGLGMAVVWGTVKDHNGYIDIESEEGKGTTFRLYFPSTRKAITREEPQITMGKVMGKGESVLVVDDAEEQREIASVILRRLGYKVSSVSSGESALDFLADHSADLIVLDMIMEPGIDGLETYRRIVARRPGQKAIIASGFSETARIKEALKLGAGQYIRKPYTIEKIGMAVRKELESGG
ncbi:MAG: response regulator [Pseudomonadota bacterium]